MISCSSGSKRCLVMNVILIILVIYSNCCYAYNSNRLTHFNSFYKTHQNHHQHHHQHQHHQCNNIKQGRISIQKKLYDSINNNPDDDWMNDLIEEPDDDDDAESNAESNDFLQYLNEEYDKLKGSKQGLSFDSFIDWTEVRDVLDDEFLELDDLVEIWKNKVGSIQDSCSRTQFLDVNEAIDEAV